MPDPVKLPLLFPKLHEGQQAVHDDPRRFKVLAAGRRWGKTRLGILMCIEWCNGIVPGDRDENGDARQSRASGIAWWVAPSYKIAKIAWKQLEKIARSIPGAEIRKAELEVEFPTGGVVAIRSADSQGGLRGEGLVFVVLDEAAHTKDETVWTEELRPSLSDYLGGALLISTPKGFNWFYDRHQMGMDVDLKSWGAWRFPTSSNPYIDPQEIIDARYELGPYVFGQEYEAKFLELEGGIFKQEWFRYFTELKSFEMEIDEDGNEVQVEKVFYKVGDRLVKADDCSIGATVDLAASEKELADYTSITVYTETPAGELLVLHQVREHLETPKIIGRMQGLQQKWQIPVFGVETAGFQLSFIQFARKATNPKLRIRKLKADRDKVARAMPLTARMDAGEVYFRAEAPWLPELERELMAFPNGDHDDQVDTLAYAVLSQVRRKKWRAY